jgi:ADP-dependent NAD(P)H-hydrate dehydratase / NAD(P)H-hydrate epimerase
MTDQHGNREAMRIVTSAQMRQIEEDTFASGRAEPGALMAQAGSAVARHALAALARPDSAAALILVGPGNNGGDGLVVAEALLRAGIRPVTVWLYHREGLKNAPVAPDLLTQTRTLNTGDAAALREAIACADVIVDAIYGIGARDHLPDDLVPVLRAVNERARDPHVHTIALDIPTGVNADTGAVTNSAFTAQLTVTLGRPKRGLYLPPGVRYTGAIAVEPIGLTEGDLPDDTPHLIARADAAQRLPRRLADAHKGDAGSLMIVGGSGNYLGATVLSAHAALRAGVGLLTLAMPQAIVGTVAAQIAEATYLPLAEAEWGIVGPDGVPTITDALGRYTALQVGNGLGRHEATSAFLARLFGFDGVPAGVKVPVLFDADGLNWLSTVDRWWERLAHLQLVLTPHQGELARLRKVARDAIAAAPWEAASKAAREWGQTVVLKGGHSVIATPGGALYVTPQANPALAAAGTGDTLAGLIAGLLTQGLTPADAAIAGLWLGSRAADLARAAIGTLPLLAGDLPRYIGQAIRELETE